MLDKVNLKITGQDATGTVVADPNPSPLGIVLMNRAYADHELNEDGSLNVQYNDDGTIVNDTYYSQALINAILEMNSKFYLNRK